MGHSSVGQVSQVWPALLFSSFLTLQLGCCCPKLKWSPKHPHHTHARGHVLASGIWLSALWFMSHCMSWGWPSHQVCGALKNASRHWEPALDQVLSEREQTPSSLETRRLKTVQQNRAPAGDSAPRLVTQFALSGQQSGEEHAVTLALRAFKGLGTRHQLPVPRSLDFK